MSKNKKAGKRHNHSRPESKNNPDGRRNDPETDWPKYNGGRRSEGRGFVRWMRRMAGIAREILGTAPGTRGRRVSAILVSILKREENLSCWGLIKRFDRHPGDLELCGLPKPYCRSWHQLRMSEIDPAVLQKIITRMAGGGAVHGTLPVDSGGFGMARHVDWQNAKHGRPGVRPSAKLRIMHTPHGMACAAAVAPGKANDSPYLRAMVDALPEGDGDALADAAYGGVKNCNAVRDGGRRAVIDSKSSAVIKGFNARAEVLGFREGHPGTFHRLLRLRNNVKERLLVHEGAVRRGGARPQGEDTVGGAAVDDHLLQHGLCLGPRRGGGAPAAVGRLRTTARGPPLATGRRAART